jgi:hypothetical protein
MPACAEKKKQKPKPTVSLVELFSRYTVMILQYLPAQERTGVGGRGANFGTNTPHVRVRVRACVRSFVQLNAPPPTKGIDNNDPHATPLCYLLAC